MTLLSRNFIVSVALALSDFISFIISIYLAMNYYHLCRAKMNILHIFPKMRGGLHYIGC